MLVPATALHMFIVPSSVPCLLHNGGQGTDPPGILVQQFIFNRLQQTPGEACRVPWGRQLMRADHAGFYIEVQEGQW